MDKSDVNKLAKLARIKVDEDEKDKLTQDLSNILAYVGELQEVMAELPDTPEPGVVRNVMREDGEPHQKGTYSEELVSAMPDKDGKYLKVKKIL